MKIGMILDNSFPPDPRVENEISSLVKKNHTVHLFALNFNDIPEEKISTDSVKVYYHRINKRTYNKLSPLALSFPFYYWLLKKPIEKFLSSVNPDVIHIHDMAIAPLVHRINEKFQKPVVLDLHENRPEIMKEYSHVSTLPGKLLIDINKWERIQKQLAQKSDYIIVVTEFAKQDLINDANVDSKKIFSVPNTVRYEEFINSKINNEIRKKFQDYFTVIYFGSTGLRRGLESAIKAVDLVKNSIPNLRLVILGSSRDDQKLKSLSNSLGLTGHVIFKGWIDAGLFPSYLVSADVCLSPLLKNKHHDTTFANKIFQYMSFEKPVVVSNCRAQAELVKKENCGIVHTAGDPKSLADAISFLAANPSIAKQMGENGKEAVKKKYNWEITVSNLLDLYSKIEEERMN